MLIHSSTPGCPIVGGAIGEDAEAEGRTGEISPDTTMVPRKYLSHAAFILPSRMDFLPRRDSKAGAVGSSRENSKNFFASASFGRCAVNPVLAHQTGFSERDLEVLVDALSNMFSIDASTSRPSGSMTVEKIVYFEHESEYGNEQTARLGKLVTAVPSKEIPDSADDYDISVAEDLPKGVKVLQNLACKEEKTP